MHQNRDVNDLIEDTFTINGRGLTLLLKETYPVGEFKINQIIIFNNQEYVIKGIEGFNNFKGQSIKALLVKDYQIS